MAVVWDFSSLMRLWSCLLGFVFSLEPIINLGTPMLSPEVNCRGEEDAQETSASNVWCVSQALDAKIAQTVSGRQADLVLGHAQGGCSCQVCRALR